MAKAKRQAITADVDPFAAAYEQPAGQTAGKGDKDIFIADALMDGNETIFTRESVAAAISQYCEAHRKWKDGAAAMEGAEGTIHTWALARFCNRWSDEKKRPNNPKLYSDPKGTAVITWSVQDKAILMDPNDITLLTNLVGDKAKGILDVGADYVFDKETLGKVIQVNGQDTTVFDVVREALKTAPIPAELKAQLLVKKTYSKTAKGAIDKAISLVGDAPGKLIQFVKTIKAPLGLRPGAGNGK